MFFFQLFVRFSRSSQCAPGTLRLNLHPCKLPYEISQIIGGHKCEGRSKDKTKASTLSITSLVAPPLLFSPLKFQQKMAYSWGKWQGRHLSGA
jgi:hypothetical protein